MNSLNPLDFRGPEFLVFYIALAFLCHWIFRFLIDKNETSAVPTALNMADPYAIAFLRGGAEEAARIAIFSLVDRGLLQVVDDKVKIASHQASEYTKRKIEKAATDFFRTEAHPYDFFTDSKLSLACAEYEVLMVKNGLNINSDQSTFRTKALMIALIPLLLLPAVKIYLALQRGHYNILFLVMLSIVSVLLLFKKLSSPRTETGNLFLKYLKQLFSELKTRASTLEAGGKTNEAALCAAVFGLSVLSAAPFKFIETLFPAASKSNNSSCSSGCGSGCGGGGGCGGCGGD